MSDRLEALGWGVVSSYPAHISNSTWPVTLTYKILSSPVLTLNYYVYLIDYQHGFYKEKYHPMSGIQLRIKLSKLRFLNQSFYYVYVCYYFNVHR